MRSKEAAQRLGVSADLVRKIARQGLIGPVPRDRAGQRRFEESHIEQLRRVIYNGAYPNRLANEQSPAEPAPSARD